MIRLCIEPHSRVISCTMFVRFTVRFFFFFFFGIRKIKRNVFTFVSVVLKILYSFFNLLATRAELFVTRNLVSIHRSINGVVCIQRAVHIYVSYAHT